MCLAKLFLRYTVVAKYAQGELGCDGDALGLIDGLPLGLTLGASVLSQHARKPIVAWGQHKPDTNPAAAHRTCAPQCSSAVGENDGLTLGDAEGRELGLALGLPLGETDGLALGF